ncbi:MAG: hypothetical protein Q9181_004281 [Wetmoreana brouardii]
MPGYTYTLAFAETSIPMQAALIGPVVKGLQLVGDDRWVDAECESDTFPFEVVPGTPIPRFSVALSTTSRKCFYRETDPAALTINLKFTLLENKPVKVSLRDPCFEMTFNGIGQWVVMYEVGPGCSIPWFVHYKSAGPTWHGADGEILDPCPSVVTFQPGTSYICRYEVLASTLEGCLYTNRVRIAIKIQSERSGFLFWKPSDGETSEDPTEELGHWPDYGRIEFVPVVEGWDKIEQGLEDEQSGPLFRLPLELRRMIYDYAKFSEGAEEVYFKYKGRAMYLSGGRHRSV